MLLRRLQIMSANVARGNRRLTILLNALTDIDILMIQEPWSGTIGIDKSDFSPDGTNIIGTQRNGAWMVFEPLAGDLPKALTFVRVGVRGLSAKHLSTVPAHPGIVALDITYGRERLQLINVYNRGKSGPQRHALDALLNSSLDWQVPAAIAGDFNLHHHRWSAPYHLGEESEASQDLVEWADNELFDLRNEAGRVTRRGQTGQRDSVLDLCWYNMAAVGAGMFGEPEVDFNASLHSDHAAIRWTWDYNVAGRPELQIREDDIVEEDLGYKINPEKKKEWIEAFEAQLGERGGLTSPEDIEREAEDITRTMCRATEETMVKRKRYVIKSAPYWDNTCQRAFEAYRDAPRALKHRLHLRVGRVVAKAKRDYGKAVAEKANNSNLFKLAEWGAGRRRKGLGPVRKPDGTAATENTEKADVFADTFFPRDRPTVLPDQPWDPSPVETREFPDFTGEELDKHLSTTSNSSAPGASGCGYRLVKWANEVARERFRALFSACIRLGYHPRCWRVAVNVIVPKPAKKDKMAPRSYRPIALLECLSKWLEKLVNTRMQYEVGRYSLIPTNQFGCREKSSTLDAGLTLTHDVEMAWKRKLTASVLTFDISGFFDRVDHNRLCRVAEKMGFHPGLVGWLRSWLSDRRIQFKLNGQLTDARECSVGVPQGSPLSPVLSAMYTAWIANSIKDTRGAALSFYVDDGALSAFTPTLETNVLVIEEGFKLVSQRLAEVGLPIDKDKCEAMHFTRRRGLGSPVFRPTMPDGTRLHVTARETMRWLGFFFDRRLAWGQHVKIMCNRAHSKIKALRILSNSVSGMRLNNLRQLYMSIVDPVLTYGAPLWYKGEGQRQDTKVNVTQPLSSPYLFAF
jgi:hypothetical protein